MKWASLVSISIKLFLGLWTETGWHGSSAQKKRKQLSSVAIHSGQTTKYWEVFTCIVFSCRDRNIATLDQNIYRRKSSIFEKPKLEKAAVARVTFATVQSWNARSPSMADVLGSETSGSSTVVLSLQSLYWNFGQKTKPGDASPTTIFAPGTPIMFNGSRLISPILTFQRLFTYKHPVNVLA